FIGAGLLGAGTLRDISLSIFVGIIVGTIATLFIQAPLYALFRRNDDDITDRDERILRRRGYETDQETENDAETATSQ
ncbi:MAG: protein translocase subunit SecF, partial [Yaniella sp.]|nr:protein translocase subunit SecF [Yaniella sp.]